MGSLFERTIWPVQQVLENSGYNACDIDEIVLVDGTVTTRALHPHKDDGLLV